MESKADVAKRQYDEMINNMVARRTRYETMTSNVAVGYYRLPEELRAQLADVIAQMPDAVKNKIKDGEQFTLQDLMPSLYPFGTNKRKEQAEQQYTANLLFTAWEELRAKNYEEVDRCVLEYRQMNL